MIGVQLVFLGATALYILLFAINLSSAWFNPLYTNDDAQQQLFPLWKAIDPALFPNDIITRVMEGYLPPLHYWLSYGIMHFTKDSVMTGHWVAFIQMFLAVTFLFAAVRQAASVPAACVSVFWFLLSQPIWTRLVAGLPRGWAAPVFTAFLFGLLAGRHGFCVVVIVLGVFLNPPAAFLVAAAYSIWLAVLLISPSSRKNALRPAIIFAITTPFIALSALQVTKTPSYIGSMVSYSEAEKMEAFKRPGGRFAFIPFRSAIEEIGNIGTKSFLLNRQVAGSLSPEGKILIPAILLLLFTSAGIRFRTMVIPRQLWVYLAGILLVYFLSRLLAFKLYVPDRHLLIPMNLAWITIVPIAVWRIWFLRRGPGQEDLVSRYRSGGFALLFTVLCLVGINGIGLRRTPGLHTRTDSQSGLYQWLRTRSDLDDIVASQPARIDLLPLKSQRSAFATAEVAHPFYPKYYAEISRRILISLSAYYSRSWERFAQKMREEKIDYFIFFKSDFSPESLSRVRFFQPFGRKLRKWTAHPPEEYLPFRFTEVEPVAAHRDFIVYEDDDAILIDVNQLLVKLDARTRTNSVTSADID